MAETIRTIEAVPEEWPDTVTPAWVWQRIESWCNTRWTPREVVWLIQGEGEWTPPLTPAVITTVETYAGTWGVAAAAVTPFGAIALRGDSHRVTAIVGADNPASASVIEAARRLTAYAESAGGENPAHSSYSASVGPIREETRREAHALPQMLQNSGAADLLRPYRKAR